MSTFENAKHPATTSDIWKDCPFLLGVNGRKTMTPTRYFIRFGDVPKNERSSIYNGDAKIGEEQGVSVYDAVKMDGKWRVVLPEKLSTGMARSFVSLMNNTFQDEWEVEFPYKMLLVTGDVVGKGTDGEPLLRNVVILEELSICEYAKEGVEATDPTQQDMIACRRAQAANDAG